MKHYFTKKAKVFAAFFAGILMPIFGFSQCPTTATTSGGYKVEYLGVEYIFVNGQCKTKFTYRVTDPPGGPDISHFVFGNTICASCFNDASDFFEIEGAKPEIGSDPTTGICGLKFDEGFRNGEVKTVSFTLNGGYEVGSVTFAVKAGNMEQYATICGPSCTPRPCVRTEDCPRYRSISSGNWDNPAIWEFLTNPLTNTWTAGVSAPPSNGGVVVNVRHDVIQNTDYTVFNCPLILDDNGFSKLTINPDITLRFAGGTDGNAYFNSRPVVVKSTADGTGAIGTMLANSKTNGDDNVTVERYIPGTKRRWNVLTFGVLSNTATIRDAWAGGSRDRVDSSQNAHDGVPFGTPPAPWNPKPLNVPYSQAADGLPADYVVGDGTIITGHRHTAGTTANSQGYDWWPELIIRAGSFWWESPTKRILANNLVTTPSSIRPYRPGTPSAGENKNEYRGTGWVSDGAINTGYNGGSLINTSLTDAFNQHQAFMLYTRGDRKVLENWYNATTLRPTGQLMTLTRTVPISNPNDPNKMLSVVANPYPAPIDFDKVYDSVPNQAVIKPYFFVWDSNLPGTTGNGGWRVVFRVGDNNWQSTINLSGPPFTNPIDPPLVNPQFISSSQGILVEGNGTGGNLGINEGMKGDITQLEILPFEEPAEASDKPGILFTNLHTKSASTGNLNTIDGVAILLGNDYKADLTDDLDIRKVNSITGGLALSINRNTDILMVESHPNPTDEAVFPLETRELTQRGYAFSFNVKNLYADGREVYLKDKFLNTLTPISTIENTIYEFEGTTANGSVSPSRFEIVIKAGSVLPVNFTYMNAAELRGDVNVTWGVATEKNMNRYEVEHSRNGIDFGKAIKVDAKNESPANYSWLHIQPGTGNHFYRVRAVDNDGKNLLTRVVKVTIGGDKPDFKVFPTVVNTSADVTLQLISLEKGNYNIQVVDMSGRVIQSQTIKHNGGSASMIMKVPASLSTGKYNIRLNNQQVNFVESILKD